MVDDLTGMTMPAGYIFFRAGAAANQLELYVDPSYNGGYPAYNLAGQYKVVIPKKVVKFNNGVSKEITLNYTVTGSQTGKELIVTGSTPASGDIVEKLEEVVVDWNMNITIPGEDAIEAYVEDVHGIVRSTVKASLTGLAGNQIRYVLENPITEAGIFNLVIPMGDVLDFDTETVRNEDVVLTFTVTPAAQGIEVVSSNPVADSIVESLETITVVFNKAVGYDGYFEKARLEVEGKVIANVKEVTYVDGDQWSAQTLVFTLDAKVTEANVYQFIIPAKSITDASDWMTMMDKDVVLYFTIGAAQVDEILIVSSTPADGETVSREFTEMFVTFNTGVFVFITPIVYDATGLEVSNTTLEMFDANGELYPDNFAHLKLTTPLGKGTYDVVFTANSICTYPEMYMYNEKEFRIKVSVDPTGINGIAADPVNGYVVYDLNGFRVMQTMNAADLNRLNNGLYIINGVKVLINK
ncbi:MAG: Ig-like domain-containing protein, partial [Bacteroidaceae bacterium]|nr:Ig-like domain-containing protein [Bacteroidaceae bacterium]